MKIEDAKNKIKEILEELVTENTIKRVEITETGAFDFSKKREMPTAILYPAYLTGNNFHTTCSNMRVWNIDIGVIWKNGKGSGLGFNGYEKMVEKILNKFDDRSTLDKGVGFVNPAVSPPMEVEGNEDYIMAGVTLTVNIKRNFSTEGQ